MESTFRKFDVEVTIIALFRDKGRQSCFQLTLARRVSRRERDKGEESYIIRGIKSRDHLIFYHFIILGSNCWGPCSTGKCDWCGTKGYCCRMNWSDANSYQCRNALSACDTFHCCTALRS